MHIEVQRPSSRINRAIFYEKTWLRLSAEGHLPVMLRGGGPSPSVVINIAIFTYSYANVSKALST